MRGWIERASALGSPYLRVASGFYRAELAGQPEVIEAERRYVVAVLQGALPAADDAGVMLLLENHSDFTADEYARIVDELGAGRIGVFLDVINPVAAMEDPLPVIAAWRRWPRRARQGLRARCRSRPTTRYHRRGFEVRYRYPGEGVAPLRELVRPSTLGCPTASTTSRSRVWTTPRRSTTSAARLAPALALLRRLIEEEHPA